jgi:radical SAM protein with 4Fe4S-binding SPASM domain
MSNNKINNKIGRGKVSQKVIDLVSSNNNLNAFYNIFLENSLEIKQFIKKDATEIQKNFWLEFFETKSFNMQVNTHIIKYVFHNKKNVNKVYRYINFRFFFEQVSLKKIETDYPPYLLIEPVSTCNLRCPFCFQTDKTFTKKPFMGTMKLDLFKNIIDQANELGVGAITIASRGEPTLHKDLGEMLKYAKSKENIFEIKLNTNATKLTEGLCNQIFESEVNQVVISADHYEKKTFEELRKNSNFETIVKNVKLLFETRKKFKNPLTEIRVSGIDFYKSTNKNIFRDFWIKISDEVTIGDALERWDTYNNKPHPEINDPCENLWDRMYIWFDGKVNPCDADYKSYLSYGNVNEFSIKKLWNSKIIKNIRNKHITNQRSEIDPCNKCGVTFV